MKITISYDPSEEAQAFKIRDFVLHNLPKVRVHQSADKPPFTRLYLSTKKPDPPNLKP